MHSYSGNTFATLINNLGEKLGDRYPWPVDLKYPEADFNNEQFSVVGFNRIGIDGKIKLYLESGDTIHLDRDADGTADTEDAFPDDPKLQSLPTTSTSLPVTTGLTLWLDGDKPHGDTSSFLDEESFTTWSDFSGNNYHAVQLDSTYIPKILTATQNGKSVIHFTGTPNSTTGSFDYLELTNLTGDKLLNGEDASIFVLQKIDTAGIGYSIGYQDGVDKWRLANNQFQSSRGDN